MKIKELISVKTHQVLGPLKISESGRTMLETVLVIAIIIFITAWALAGYQTLVAKQIADTLYNDILIEVQSQRGKNFRNKSVYDSGFGRRTRYGNVIDVNRDSTTRHLFHLYVRSVQTNVCPYLQKKDWSKALGTTNYTPENVICSEDSTAKTFDFHFDFAD